jgi:hypothetical protein
VKFHHGGRAGTGALLPPPADLTPHGDAGARLPGFFNTLRDSGNHRRNLLSPSEFFVIVSSSLSVMPSAYTLHRSTLDCGRIEMCGRGPSARSIDPIPIDSMA